MATEATLPDGRREVAFAPTISMSTYLVALVVGPFDATDVVDVDGTGVSVVCTPGNSQRLTAFALEAAVASLRFYADYSPGSPTPAEKARPRGDPRLRRGGYGEPRAA